MEMFLNRITNYNNKEKYNLDFKVDSKVILMIICLYLDRDKENKSGIKLLIIDKKQLNTSSTLLIPNNSIKLKNLLIKIKMSGKKDQELHIKKEDKNSNDNFSKIVKDNVKDKSIE